MNDKKTSNFTGIDVNGTTAWAIIDGMGAFKFRGFELIEQSGIDEIIADTNHWYPLNSILNVLKWIEEELGGETLFSIGTRIPYNAVFPDFKNINSIHQIFENLDNIYHMNHRKNGELMCIKKEDDDCVQITEGIGHYSYKPISHHSGIMTCNNPYPCDFDMGILSSILSMFTKNFQIEHRNRSICRKHGDDKCIYLLKW